jgi:hypothetical protein
MCSLAVARTVGGSLAFGATFEGNTRVGFDIVTRGALWGSGCASHVDAIRLIGGQGLSAEPGC